MIRPFCIALCLFFLISGKSQGRKKQDEEPPAIKTKCNFISLRPDLSVAMIPLPFSKIDIEDVRPDTSKMGYSARAHDLSFSGAMTKVRKLCMENGLARSASIFLNSQYQKVLDSNSSDHLLICIKKCWFSDFDTSTINQLNESAKFPDERMYFKAEMYLRSGESFYPMYRFDSVFTDKIDNSYQQDDVLANALTLMIERLRHTDFTLVKQRRSLSNKDVESLNNQLISAPVFQVPMPAKGVYMSFEEFKSNRPSFTNYELNFASLTDVLRVQGEDGNFFITQGAWGVCDGKNIFIKLGRNFFRLYPADKTWEFYGSGGLFRDYRSAPVPVMIPGTGMFVAPIPLDNSPSLGKLFPYQIDIETGKIY